MPELVQGDVPVLEELRYCMCQTAWLDRFAVGLADDVEAVIPLDTERQQFFGLGRLPLLASFSRTGPGVELFSAPNNGKLTELQINRVPGRGGYLASASPHSVASESGMNTRCSRAASNILAGVGASIVVTGLRL